MRVQSEGAHARHRAAGVATPEPPARLPTPPAHPSCPPLLPTHPPTSPAPHPHPARPGCGRGSGAAGSPYPQSQGAGQPRRAVPHHRRSAGEPACFLPFFLSFFLSFVLSFFLALLLGWLVACLGGWLLACLLGWLVGCLAVACAWVLLPCTRAVSCLLPAASSTPAAPAARRRSTCCWGGRSACATRCPRWPSPRFLPRARRRPPRAGPRCRRYIVCVCGGGGRARAGSPAPAAPLASCWWRALHGRPPQPPNLPPPRPPPLHPAAYADPPGILVPPPTPDGLCAGGGTRGRRACAAAVPGGRAGARCAGRCGRASLLHPPPPRASTGMSSYASKLMPVFSVSANMASASARCSASSANGSFSSRSQRPPPP